MMTYSLAPDTALQRQAYAALEQHSKNPEFVRYLAFIFARGYQLGPAARAVAGLTLKRIIDTSYASLPSDVQRNVRVEVLRTLGDEDAGIRHAAANAISTIVRDADLAAWPELPAALNLMIDASLPAFTTEGALTALVQITEDVGGQLDSAELGNPLESLVPKLVAWMQHPSEVQRRLATTVMANLLYTRARPVANALEPYMSALAALTSDTSPTLRREVSKSLGTLVEVFPERLWVHLPSIISFQLACTLDADTGVALSACEFWSLVLELINDAEVEASLEDGGGESRAAALQPFMGQLVSALLRRMVLTADDAGGGPDEENAGDATIVDRPEDVRPHIFRSRAAGALSGRSSVVTPLY